MMDIGPAEKTARITTTTGFDRSGISLEAGISQPQRTVMGESGRVAAVARRQDAIEHVHAARHSGQNILRPAHAHEIAGPGRWQRGDAGLQSVQHLYGCFANAEAPEGITGKVQGSQGSRTTVSK